MNTEENLLEAAEGLGRSWKTTLNLQPELQ